MSKTNKRSASAAGFGDFDRERGAVRQCLKHVNTTLKRPSAPDAFKPPAKRQQRRRVLAHIKPLCREGFWAVAQQEDWDALEAAANVRTVTLHTTASSEPILISANDVLYRTSELHAPSSFRRAWGYFVDDLGMPIATIEGFSVAFNR
jgi:hypothetical protein